ncbi:MAG TPA: SbmA/BacA-like family transporter [Gemmataceae bacterium]|nr:SbmA/BacA-like family transporter [Gemmataceae bacterium]
MISAARRAWSRFIRISKLYFTSDSRWQALGLLAALLALLLIISGLNVAISYVGRDFMTAITSREIHQITVFALLYVGVFAASTVAGAISRFVELLLGLRWREWLTRQFVHQYLTSHAFSHLNRRSEVDNPDQRISEDLRTFTTTSLSFLIMATNSVLTIIAFMGVLWSITPWLVLAGVVYPLLGTTLIVFLGHRLVGLNNLQLKKEADFRFELVHVRTHADSVALAQSEPAEQGRLEDRLAALVRNYRSIIAVLRNLKFVTGGYNYLDQLIPVLIVVPLYLRGEVEFGVVTQAAMAFSQIFNAFSLIAEKFQDLSTFAAVVARVGSLEEAMTESIEPSRQPIQVAEAEAPVAYQQVTLRAPKDERVLVRDLSLEVPHGRRILLTGPNSAGQYALFHAAAGLWNKGSGHIRRPAHQRVMFLPEQPYMVPGTMRDQFRMAVRDGSVSDERIRQALGKVHLDDLVDRLGGLDTENDWGNALTLGEQQRIAFARLLLTEPDYAFLYNAASALSESQREEVYKLLKGTPISYISVGDLQPSLLGSHDTLIELRPDGSWKTGPIPRKDGQPS